MTDCPAPKIPKWPFVLSDLLLLALAGWIARHGGTPLGPWAISSLVVCAVAGAWICITPFSMEYRASLRLCEADNLATAVEQIKNLQTFSNQISFATAQWQLVQEQSARTLLSAKEMAEQMTAEAKAFGEFMQKTNDAEKSHLRLEVEKLRRSEGDWLHVLVRLLDHVYALHQAGVRSGQTTLRDQLAHFQNACRDAARRIGLLAFEAQPDEPFDEKTHQLVDAETSPPAGALVAETIASGYTFQGQLLRGAVVTVKSADQPEMEPASQL